MELLFVTCARQVGAWDAAVDVLVAAKGRRVDGLGEKLLPTARIMVGCRMQCRPAGRTWLGFTRELAEKVEGGQGQSFHQLLGLSRPGSTLI